jgi:hypothetical protein
MTNPDKRLLLYKHLLSLYPRAYREQFGGQMLQTAEDMLNGATDKQAQQQLWLRLAVDMPINIGRQQLKHLGGNMNNTNQRLMKAVLGVAIAVLAILAFPYLRAVGTTWMNTAGMLRMVGLLLFGLVFILAPLTVAASALFNRPKFAHQKLQD